MEGLLNEIFNFTLFLSPLLLVHGASRTGALPIVAALSTRGRVLRTVGLAGQRADRSGTVVILKGDVAQQDEDLIRADRIVSIEVIPVSKGSQKLRTMWHGMAGQGIS